MKDDCLVTLAGIMKVIAVIILGVPTVLLLHMQFTYMNK